MGAKACRWWVVADKLLVVSAVGRHRLAHDALHDGEIVAGEPDRAPKPPLSRPPRQAEPPTRLSPTLGPNLAPPVTVKAAVG